MIAVIASCRFTSRVGWAAVAGMLLTMAILWSGVVRGAEPAPAATEDAPATEPTGPLQVTVGFYLTTMYALDQQASTYYADFYLWLRWRGDRDPATTVELLNNIERQELSMVPVNEEPIELPSGEFLREFHVQGQFFQPLSLMDYPLDEHGLTIELEDSTYHSNQQVYVADEEQSGISFDVRLPGWRVTGWRLSTPTHTYASGFGNPATASQEYSTIRFTLSIERPPSFFAWKLLLPLLIVLLLGCSVLLVHPTFIEVRLAGPATAMLALIFLQQTYSSSLPENGSLVLLDKIYVLAYALVIGLIVTTIVTSHWVRDHPDANTARAARLDRRAAAGLFAVFVVGTVILWLPRASLRSGAVKGSISLLT